MRNWLSGINAEPGFIPIVLEEISKFPQTSRNCNLVFNAMLIKNQTTWKQWETEFSGQCDYGNGYTLENTEGCATSVLVFMLVSLSGKWKWPIGHFFINSITSSVQCELVKNALSLCQQSGIKVWSVTCDGAYVNLATMNLLGCELFVTEYHKLRCSFKHLTADYHVYFVPDACHNLKLARNALSKLTVFKSSSGLIKWRHITELHDLQKDLNLKIANKLSDAHINFRGNIMKVKYAAQTLSQSTADAMDFLKLTEIDGFRDCTATIEFIRIIDETFDFLNSRNPFAKELKKPIYMNNISNLQKNMEKNMNYLFSLTTEANIPLCKGGRKTFISGFAAAIKSIFSIVTDILNDLPLKYLMTYRFSQDHLELFFA